MTAQPLTDWPEVAQPGAGVPVYAVEELPDGVELCTTASCRAKIRKPLSENGNPMPVDADPQPDGNLVWRKSDRYGWVMHVLGKGEQPQPRDEGRRYVPHFVTCKKPEEHRKPRPAKRARAPKSPAPEETAASAALAGAGLQPEEVRAPLHLAATGGRRVDRPAPAKSAPKPAPPKPRAAVRQYVCQSPTHDTPQPARLYAGGAYCDPCAAKRREARR